MNAALTCLFEGAEVLLITDAYEPLSWEREEQPGWGVGIFASDELDHGVETADSCDSNDPAALPDLIRSIVKQHTRRHQDQTC